MNSIGSPRWRERSTLAAICSNNWPAKGDSFMQTEENASVIDTSKMSSAQRAAMELTEAARDTPGAKRGFCGGLFLGQFNLGALHPSPRQSPEDHDQGDAFLNPLEKFLREKVDPDEIDRTGEIPDAVLTELGA